MSVNVEPQLNHSPPSESSLTQTASENTGIRQGGKSTPPEVEQTSLEDDWYSNPANARNWSFVQKWTAMLIVSLYTFLAPLASAMMAPGLPEIATKYAITNSSIVALSLSIYVLGFAIGPLFLAPLSEMYGRTWILHIGNVLSLAFSLGCAFSPTAGALIGFRLLSGLSGSAPLAVGGGSLSDLFAEDDRATAMAVYCVGPLIGPVIGPIAGGFIAQTIGVKWVYIVTAIACGVASAISLPLLRETYAPVIRQRLAARSGDPEKVAAVQPDFLKDNKKLHYIWINLSRPIVLLFGSMICFMLSLYMAFLYGTYYLMFSTFAEIFSSTYHFKPGVGGLAYIGLGVGFVIATIFGAKYADWIYKYLAEKNGGEGTPEMRIPALFFASFFVPIGIFWYGWSAQAGIQWIMPIIGTGIFGFGMMTSYLAIQLYLVDSFVYAASAISACSTFRSLFGFGFPLFGEQMFHRLGLGGGNSLLAGVAIVLGIPFPLWLYYKGAAMRAGNPLTQASTLPKKKLTSPQ